MWRDRDGSWEIDRVVRSSPRCRELPRLPLALLRLRCRRSLAESCLHVLRDRFCRGRAQTGSAASRAAGAGLVQSGAVDHGCELRRGVRLILVERDRWGESREDRSHVMPGSVVPGECAFEMFVVGAGEDVIDDL